MLGLHGCVVWCGVAMPTTPRNTNAICLSASSCCHDGQTNSRIAERTSRSRQPFGATVVSAKSKTTAGHTLSNLLDVFIEIRYRRWHRRPIRIRHRRWHRLRLLAPEFQHTNYHFEQGRERRLPLLEPYSPLHGHRFGGGRGGREDGPKLRPSRQSRSAR